MTGRIKWLQELLWTMGPLIAVAGVVLATFWFAAQFIAPAPPTKITIAAASKGSPYYQAAERYRAFLAESGISLDILETQGSLDNLARIRNSAAKVDAAFVQGGLSNGTLAPELRSIGRVFQEPVWVFTQGDPPQEKLSALKGKRVLVGPAGSGTEATAIRLLSASGVTGETATLINMALPDYVTALESGAADAGFLVLAPEAVTIGRLFASPRIRLMNLVQADAYVQRFPYLQALDLKEGVIDFARDIPPTDSRLLATTTALVIHEDLHPALVSLLTAAAISVHGAPRFNAKGEAALFHRAGVFPLAHDQEFPLAPEAARVYASGPSFLQRYLPFWLATLVDRLFVLLLPAIGILLPALRFAPALYTWRVRRRLLHWYRELRRVESETEPTPTPAKIAAALEAIDAIELSVDHLPIPLTFADQFYDLRGHINVARNRLVSRQAPNPPPCDTPARPDASARTSDAGHADTVHV